MEIALKPKNDDLTPKWILIAQYVAKNRKFTILVFLRS